MVSVNRMNPSASDSILISGNDVGANVLVDVKVGVEVSVGVGLGVKVLVGGGAAVATRLGRSANPLQERLVKTRTAKKMMNDQKF